MADNEVKKYRCSNPDCSTRVADPLYYRPDGLCFECHLNTYIPRWYTRAEKYLHIPVSPWLWASKRPSLGIGWLDERRTLRDAVARLVATHRGKEMTERWDPAAMNGLATGQVRVQW